MRRTSCRNRSEIASCVLAEVAVVPAQHARVPAMLLGQRRVYQPPRFLHGVPTRSVDNLVKAMGMSGISKSQVSRLCAEIDERVQAFLNRPIEGSWPYLWIDATYMKVRQVGRIVCVAVIIAVGVNTDGCREVLGLEVGPSDSSKRADRGSILEVD